MPKGISYADAVMLLGGDNPTVAALDNLIGGVLSAAVAVPGVLSLFDAKSEAIKVAHHLSGTISRRVHGASRLDRNERLRAAHSIIVVSSLFEAFDDLELPFSLRDVDLSRADQAGLVGESRADNWLATLLRSSIPSTGPTLPFPVFSKELQEWYNGQSRRLLDYLNGLALLENLTEGERARVNMSFRANLPDSAGYRYQASYVALAAQIPEFGAWAWRLDASAKDTALDQVNVGLRQLERALAKMGPALGAGELREALAAASRADLRVPVAGDEQDTSGCVIPSLDSCYLDPQFLARSGGPSDNPADERWWQRISIRKDLSTFLTVHLTTPEAAAAPLLILGQPGSGKSALTRVLAARLPSGAFFPLRVPLRDVPADADVQEQIEYAVRIATGERVSWPELFRASNGALPVILLDGFDELLQATGVSQSDYLTKIARFQRREAALQRPVAVVVTSRTAVANRASMPVDTSVVRLEPFSRAQVDKWIDIWNTHNSDIFGNRATLPLALEVVERHGELARQPLLLLMLALYDAQENALQLQKDKELSRARLYERLLTSFANREIHKEYAGPLPKGHGDTEVEHELLRLAVVAFAMANRDRQWVTAEELSEDLLNLLGDDQQERSSRYEGFSPPRSQGEQVVGRFFFIHHAQAVQNERYLHTYEFLHATFGEFLIARLLIRLLVDAASRGSKRQVSLRPVPAHDDLLYSLLSFAPLTGQGSTALEFAMEISASDQNSAVRDWLLRAFRLASSRLDVPIDVYKPVLVAAGPRLIRYSLNLVLLAIASGGKVAASALFDQKSDIAERLGRAAHGWQSTLSSEEWDALLDVLTVQRCWRGDRRDVHLDLDFRRESPVPRMDSYWLHGVQPEGDHPPVGAVLAALASPARTSRAMELRLDPGEDVIRHAVEPVDDLLGNASHTFHVTRNNELKSLARILIEAWTGSTRSTEPAALRETYDQLVDAVAGPALGPNHNSEGETAVRIALDLLTRDVYGLPSESLSGWLRKLSTSPHFGRPHAAAFVNCCALAGAKEQKFRLLAMRVSFSYHDLPPRDKLLLEISLDEIASHSGPRADLTLEMRSAVLATDRALLARYLAVGNSPP